MVTHFEADADYKYKWCQVSGFGADGGFWILPSRRQKKRPVKSKKKLIIHRSAIDLDVYPPRNPALAAKVRKVIDQ
jgi:hypothetical protein